MFRSSILALTVACTSTLAVAATTDLDPKQTAANLDERIAKFQKVEMTFTDEDLSPRERKVVSNLIEASRALERIYWEQSDPAAYKLYQQLRTSTDEADRRLRHFIWINGGHYDLVSENEPFIGTEAMPPGRNLYPTDLTRDEFEAYVKAHPDQKDKLYDERTVIRRGPNGTLRAIPYHVAYAPWLKEAAKSLRAAASYSDDKAFAKFLRLRADALLTDDYYASDVAWVTLNNPKIDIIFAPYETYLDSLLGVKTSYGAAVLIRNETESAKLATFQKYVPEIQKALPLAAEDLPSKEGKATPMEVMDAPFRAGDLRHGYQAAADNLPNDPRIHEKYGSKKIFFKNFMDARVDDVILPVAKRLMRDDQAAKASAEGYLAAVMMHEISHGLGPAFARVNGQQTDIRQAIGAVYSGLEEAKADVTGMFGLQWLVDHGALPKERLEEYYASYVGGIFRTVRFGTGEAHGRAEMMEFNYLAEQGAITRDASDRYVIDYAKIPGALASLTKELLEQEATGDRARAEAWFAKYDKMPAELTSALQAAKDIPVDVDPLSKLEGVK